jgi:hypothetical protein
MISLFKILKEASFERDYSKNQEAKQILQQIKDRLNAGKYSEYSDGAYGFKIGDLNIRLYPEKSIGAGLMALGTGRWGNEATFSPDEKELKSFGNKIIKTKDKLEYKLNDEQIYHELIHYLDSRQIGRKKMSKMGTQYSKQYSNASSDREKFQKYYNNPMEFNAHFFEYIMPKINYILDKQHQLPQNANDFTKEVLDEPDIHNFYMHLNDKLKRNFMKRLGVYYQGVRDLQNGKLNINQHVYKKPNFIQRLKNMFT